MLGRTYDDEVCSLARSLEVVGERWTLLIVRDALLGLRRFEEFSASLGVARNVLADRLARLVTAEVLERIRYQRRPDRYEYQLTERGRDLAVAVLALMQWGDQHLAGPAGPPRLARHRKCGGLVAARAHCPSCGGLPGPEGIDIEPGPGAGTPSPTEAPSRSSTETDTSALFAREKDAGVGFGEQGR